MDITGEYAALARLLTLDPAPTIVITARTRENLKPRKPETMQPDAELHRRPARILDGRLRWA
jgi:hypothetical protein